MRSNALGVLFAVLVGGPGVSRAVLIQWSGAGDGTSWSQPANWTPATVPSNGSTTYEVQIGGTPSVAVNGGFRINSIALASGASLSIGEGAFLGFNSDSLNDGTIRLQDDTASSNATLRFEGVARLGGAGRVLFGSGNVNQLGPLSGSHVLTVGAQQTIGTAGPGTRGYISGLIVNEGTVDANGGRIDLAGANKTNLGLIRARNGGSLAFSGFTLANLGGTIDLDATSSLVLEGRIDEGMISGAGRLLPGTPGELLDVELGGVTAEIRDNQFLDILGGTLTNNGTIRLLDDPAVPQLVAAFRTHDAVLLDGSGSIVFASNGNNQIGGFSGTVLTIGSGQTITTSSGALGSISSTFVNHGTIEANGGNLTIGGLNKTNTGLMRARGGGNLTFSSFTLNNAGGRVELSDLASTLDLSGARVSGGVIQGTGVLRPGTPGELANVALDGVTAEIRDNQFLDILGGTLTNNGTIRLLDDPAVPQLVAAFRTHDAVLLDGSGSIVFASNGNNQIGGFSGTVLTIGSGQTITTSSGALGSISSTFVNQGTIEANGGNLTIGGANKTNAGVLRARHGGNLTLSQFTLDNSAGSVELSDAASTLDLSSARISGGVIQGSGVLRPGFPGELANVELEGVTAEIRDNQFLDILGGTLTNNGTIRLLDDPAVPQLVAAFRTHDAVLLDGSGSIVFASGGNNQIGGFSGSTLSVGADQTIRTAGPGTSGAIGVHLTNQGSIVADGGSLAISGALTNDGLLQASNAGVLDVQSDVAGNGRWSAGGGTLRIAAGRRALTGGNVSILADGELELLGPRMTGATFLVEDGGVLDVDGTLAATAGLDARVTDPADWQWGPVAALEIANASGAPAGAWQGWAFVEVGGADTGPGGTFSNQNLWLPRLVIGPQSRVFLSDEIDNGNRGAGGQPEALYVGSLVFSDATGLLDLNGLHLYYQSLSGSPSQIIDVPVPPDRDRDGIENSADRCPYWPSADQRDTDGNGIGNVCECGDQNEDGQVDVRDLVAINNAIFGSVPVSPLCDTNNDARCNVSDIVGANTKIFGRPAFCSRYPFPAP